MNAAPHIAELLAAIDALEDAVEANATRYREIRRRIRWLRTQISRQGAVATIVQNEPAPLVVELLTRNIETLHNASATFRQAEAHALHREGLTMERIAELFGVTRQRVSVLLSRHPDRAQQRDPGSPASPG
jgi:hypothetical protein